MVIHTSPARANNTASRTPVTIARRVATQKRSSFSAPSGAGAGSPSRPIAATATITASASTAGSAVSASDWCGPSTPTARRVPITATATKLTELLRRKKATERRAMWSAGIPPRRRIHAPSASPPAPLAGTIEPMPSSAHEISQLVRHDMRSQNTGRKSRT